MSAGAPMLEVNGLAKRFAPRAGGTAAPWILADLSFHVGEREFLLQRNESTFIPMETLHRLENPTDRDIHLIEVQCGDYFGEDDIVRLEDVYGRTAKP